MGCVGVSISAPHPPKPDHTLCISALPTAEAGTGPRAQEASVKVCGPKYIREGERVGEVSNWVRYRDTKGTPAFSTAPREKNDKCSFCQGEFFRGKHQLLVIATEQSSEAEKVVGEVHWPGAPEL